MPPIPERPPRITGDLVRNNLVAFLGDSITNNTSAERMGSLEYHSYASILSGGRLRWAGKYGEGGLGLTTPGSGGGTVFGTHLPALLAATPRPAWCVVLLGTNDLGGGITGIVTQYVRLVNTLRASRIQPVMCTLTPRFGLSIQAQIDIRALNHWIVRYSALRGWPVIDLYTSTVDSANSGTWLSGYTGDGTHPSNQGAEVMGQAVVDQLAPLLPLWPMPLVTDINTRWGFPNGLHATHSTQASGEIAGSWSMFDVTTVTYAIEAASPDAIGNWQVMTKNSGTGPSVARGAAVAASPGDVIAWGMALDWAPGSGGRITGGATFRTGLLSSSPGVSGVSGSKGNLLNFDRAVAGTIYQEVVAPAGTVGVTFDLTISDGTGELRFGQMTLRNLTAVGAA